MSRPARTPVAILDGLRKRTWILTTTDKKALDAAAVHHALSDAQPPRPERRRA